MIAVAEAAYADRVQIRSQTHSFKIGQEYGIRGFERISYAPYTREQLAFLKKRKPDGHIGKRNRFRFGI